MLNRIKKHEAPVAVQFIQKVKDDARSAFFLRYAPVIVLVFMTVLSIVFVDHFFSRDNLVNFLYQMSLPLILATGLSFVLLIGGIDLSLEGVMGCSGAVFSLLVINSVNDNNFGVFAVAAVIALSFALGTATGMAHIKMRIPSFMISFAMGNIARGLGLLSYRTQPAIIKSERIIAFSQGTLFGIPNIAIVAFAVFAAGCIILNLTAFGRAVYAVGNNEVSARSSGIDVNRVKLISFIICSVSAGIAGIMGAVLLKVGQVGIGDNMLFPTIAAVTVGGLTPGVGGMMQTFIGVAIYTELVNYLTLLGVSSIFKQAIQGIIILVAVALSAPRLKKVIVK
ncbi:MAG: ABC transporter permease [Spirochaetaceae bacterium]|jgi:ribose transport system permease protein|nr:ABC transporter permease [Spirochaetaceae bacterium]GMO17337.1 MAG: ABC transporter permease [Termitinemataceae bacterium]